GASLAAALCPPVPPTTPTPVPAPAPAPVPASAGPVAAVFGTPVQVVVGFDPVAVVASDLDGDGTFDLVVANFTSNSVSVLRGHGDGTFATPVEHPVS